MPTHDRGSSPRVRGTPCPRTRPRTARPVHPRVCGELGGQTDEADIAGGSSPRVRGTLPRPEQQPPAVRFIPACAGNSFDGCAVVHGRTGSSPRVRGTPHTRGAQGELRRFIPACAGNSRASPCAFTSWSVHPRVCGELRWRPGCPAAPAGSSPRVRGTPAADRKASPSNRFIPACAGNSRSRRAASTSASVHPRVCGELRLAAGACRIPLGSSPRVRGTLLGEERLRLPRRFIPACAGNSSAACHLPSWRAVHPRVCGELVVIVRPLIGRRGSSPRVRGTQRAFGVVPHAERFIPACAGNSRRRRRRPPSPPVHPRVCGELPCWRANPRIADGSSPRVRGTPWPRLHVVEPERFIPACAGNSPSRSGACPCRPVHPRVCGELRLEEAFDSRCVGSSPRVRGTRG